MEPAGTLIAHPTTAVQIADSINAVRRSRDLLHMTETMISESALNGSLAAKHGCREHLDFSGGQAEVAS